MKTLIALPVHVQTGLADGAYIVDAQGFTIAQPRHDYLRADSNAAMGEAIARALNAHAALLELRAKYNRLHDALDDCMSAQRLTEADLPDDFKALADMLADCVAADTVVADIIEGK